MRKDLRKLAFVLTIAMIASVLTSCEVKLPFNKVRTEGESVVSTYWEDREAFFASYTSEIDFYQSNGAAQEAQDFDDAAVILREHLVK